MIRPVEARISQLWGANPAYYQRMFGIPYHNGVDYAAPLQTPLLSIADGTVVYKDFDGKGYGNYLRIYHPDLLLFSFYAHLHSYAVQAGATVREGQQIGTMGSTGNSTGPHLHFELRLAVDKNTYAESPYAGITRGRVNPETVYRMLERLS